MTKRHRINLTIINRSSSDFTFDDAFLNQAELAKGCEWPKTIAANSNGLALECYETDSALSGCSGWVKYTGGTAASPVSLYFSFSNLVGNDNQVDVGTHETVYYSMESRETPVQRVFPVLDSEGKYTAVQVSGSQGKTCDATWIIEDVDTDIVIPANPELVSAEDVFLGIQGEKGERSYYSSTAYSVVSHFKGAGAFQNKMIFTHSNIIDPFNEQGLYLIGNRASTPGATVDITHTGYTQHNPPWAHPGGTQVCGSFMAVSLQKEDKGNSSSEVQIYDIRPTLANKDMTLVTTIEKCKSVNGVGMTKESGENGHYIVIAGDDKGLSVFRSDSDQLTENTQFPLVEKIKDENDNLPPDFHCGGSGFALATQTNGQLLIFTMHGGVGKPCTVGLYELNISDDFSSASVSSIPGITQETVVVPDISQPVKDLPTTVAAAGIATGGLPLPPGVSSVIGYLVANTDYVSEDLLNSNFRWGKGLNITSPTSIEIFATDRNVLPDIKSSKNFGMVTWQGGITADVSWATTSSSIGNGSQVDIAMDNWGNCIEMHLGAQGTKYENQLYYRVGKVNFSNNKISWGKLREYHTGSDFSIAMDSHGHCIEMHRGYNEATLYYAVGKIDFSNNDIDWGKSYSYVPGSNLSVAMNDEGYCIEVHRGSDDSDNNQKLFYRTGKVDFTSKDIDWKEEHHYDSGSDLSVTMDEAGNCIEVHRGISDNQHYYRVGHFTADTSQGTVNWGPSTYYDTGSVLSVAMRNRGNCIEVHRGSDDRTALYYRTGKANFVTQTIDWSDSKGYQTGGYVAVAMDNHAHCIEIHNGDANQNKDDKMFCTVGHFIL